MPRILKTANQINVSSILAVSQMQKSAMKIMK